MNASLQIRKLNLPLLIGVLLACVGLLPIPKTFGTDLDGVLPGNNTADGSGVLISLTSGINNSGFGFQALYHDTSGSYNTGTGVRALFNNVTGLYNTADGAFALAFNTASYNTATGYQALYSNSTGANNTANGYQALFKNNGDQNTASGYQALFKNTSGYQNAATGWRALYSNTTGFDNTANGFQALYSNTTGGDNTANGYQALYSDIANDNTATGYQALFSNTTGSGNAATGWGALYSNTAGFENTATGLQALYSNTTGLFNTATGCQALYSNTAVSPQLVGSYNTANGHQALYSNTIAGGNTASGYQALYSNTTGTLNTAYGVNALHDNNGNYNIALGQGAGYFLTTGDSNIDIGNGGAAAESKTIRIGVQGTQTATFVAGIYGATTGSMATLPVIVDSNGQLGTTASSQRFKTAIRPMDKTSEAILGLRPVTFHYKNDSQAIPQFGLVAEEVAEVNPDLVVRDKNGEVYTVRYEAVNAMLLNEFLKAHRKINEQDETIAQLKSGMEALTRIVKEQASQLQKLNTQLELSRSAPRSVLNEH